jgi:hypothetical protein
MGEGAWASGRRLLLMGSSAFRAKELPAAVRERLDEAMTRGATIIVGEARGACRLYQDYLSSRGYENVIVGHARSIRYNVGGWRTLQYGDDLKERERSMIEDCDSAVIIWVDKSGVIAKNLELLKRLGKPTFVYEYSTRDNSASWGELDPTRTYGRIHRRIRPRADVEFDRLDELIEAFLASDDEELSVECENPGMTGYYMNKLIIRKNLEDVLGVNVESGSCYLKRLAK